MDRFGNVMYEEGGASASEGGLLWIGVVIVLSFILYVALKSAMPGNSNAANFNLAWFGALFLAIIAVIAFK